MLTCGPATAAEVVAAQQPSATQSPPTAGVEPEQRLGEVIVTARRVSENLQRVPVAVSVLTEKQFSAVGAFRPEDMKNTVPGLAVSGGGDTDRSNIVFTIRGQGQVYGTLFPSVISYFNEVPIRSIGVGQFFDAESLQVLRGPQGVQFGRVTNGGNVMLTPRRPTSTFGAAITAKAGDYGLLGTQGFVNVPILSDKLMVRAAWDVTHRDGFTKNLNDGRKFDDVNYQSFRASVLFKPNDTFENLLVGQYQHVNDHGTPEIYNYQNGDAAALALSSLFPLVTVPSQLGLANPVYGIDSTDHVVAWRPGMTPLSIPGYISALQDQIAKQRALGIRTVNYTIPLFNRRNVTYLTNTTTVRFPYDITFKNVLGYTKVVEHSAENYAGDDIGFVQPCHSGCPFNASGVPFVNQEQVSEEPRLTGVLLQEKLHWTLGGYADVQRPAGQVENDTALFSVLERDLVQRNVTTSRAVYGYAEYEVLPGLKFNGGVRYTHDTVHADIANYIKFLNVPGLQQSIATVLAFSPAFAPFANAVAAATVNASVPHGNCTDYGTGGIFAAPCVTKTAAFDATTWNGGASYQVNPDLLVYAKVSRGYRPGGVNQVLTSYTPEHNTSIEAGMKGQWQIADVPVRANVAMYSDKYTDIQQTVSFVNPVSGAAESIVANVARAKIKGVELELSASPTEGMTLGLNYSYTHARFDRSNFNPAACNANQPVLIGFCPLNEFVNTPEHQLGVNFHYDVIRDQQLGTIGFGGQFYHQSSAAIANSSNSYVSPQGIEPPYSTLDLNANWTNMFGRPLDMIVFVTNATNKEYRVIANSNTNLSSIGNESDVYSAPRMFGVSLTAHF